MSAHSRLEERLDTLEQEVASLVVVAQQNELYRTAIELIADGKPNPVAIAAAVQQGVKALEAALDS